MDRRTGSGRRVGEVFMGCRMVYQGIGWIPFLGGFWGLCYRSEEWWGRLLDRGVGKMVFTAGGEVHVKMRWHECCTYWAYAWNPTDRA